MPHVLVLEPFSGGLAIARAARRMGARVTVVVQPQEPEIAHSRGVESVVAAYEPAGEPWLAAVLELAAAGEELIVVPATDRGSELLVRAADRLPPNVRAFERADSAHLALMSKDSADEIARRAGVRVPWTMQVHSLGELAAVADRAPWPCVVKPVLSHEWRAQYGEERVFLVHDVDQARQTLAGPLGDDVEMLLSQYIPGGDDDVEEAIVLRLADGSYPLRFGCRKLRQYPPGFGMTAVGESAPLPEAMAIAERVLDTAGFVGVAGIEVKRDVRTGERWFIEANVRVPAQWGLGDVAGVHATERLLAALRGLPLEPQRPVRAGVRMVLLELDVHVIGPALRTVAAWRRPWLALRLVRIYAGARELGMFDPRDPGPGIALARTSIRRRMARLAAGLRRAGRR